MPKVTIVGAGIAGLTAALHLAQRGYEVTIFESNSFVGGKFRAVEWKGSGSFHEHSYHMFLNWYHNFFDIADAIGARKRLHAA
ncbi:oleate hydratase [Bradyrhizobium sp. RDI18]|uniref:oleate hydratase n=1 Tax=Bradyrhizobium sp. RDI18 TaxID=3367400 RepID=UPI00371B88E9